MVGEESYLVEECYRLADEARRLANIPGITAEEKTDLIEVEQRWLSIARIKNWNERVQERGMPLSANE
jgi:hypothetical protein